MTCSCVGTRGEQHLPQAAAPEVDRRCVRRPHQRGRGRLEQLPTPMPRRRTPTREATDGETSSRSSRLRKPLVRPACAATAARVSPAVWRAARSRAPTSASAGSCGHVSRRTSPAMPRPLPHVPPPIQHARQFRITFVADRQLDPDLSTPRRCVRRLTGRCTCVERGRRLAAGQRRPRARRSSSTESTGCWPPGGVPAGVGLVGPGRRVPGARLPVLGHARPGARGHRRPDPRGAHHGEHRAGREALRERETIVFHRAPSGRWLAVHEHLSPLPGTAG
jgi:hypothetical protein